MIISRLEKQRALRSWPWLQAHAVGSSADSYERELGRNSEFGPATARISAARGPIMSSQRAKEIQ